MATLSVAVPDSLKKQMNDFEEINWSAVARRAFEEKLKQAQMLKKIASKSKMTEKDVAEISKKINESASEKFKGMK